LVADSGLIVMLTSDNVINCIGFVMLSR